MIYLLNSFTYKQTNERIAPIVAWNALTQMGLSPAKIRAAKNKVNFIFVGVVQYINVFHEITIEQFQRPFNEVKR